MQPLFYAPPESCNPDSIELPSSEARHAVSVLRLKTADLVIVVDGLGSAYRGEVTKATKSGLTVRVHSVHRNFGEPNTLLTLAASLSTAGKFDEVIQKGTEIGVTRFVPILSSKSRVRIDDAGRAKTKVSRLQRVALAAMKQCRRSFRPEISFPTEFAQFLEEQDEQDIKLVFHPDRDALPLDSVEMAPSTKRVTILIGPESGFSEDEADQARQSGFMPVTLGPRILRTETAAPIAAALVMARLGEFR